MGPQSEANEYREVSIDPKQERLTVDTAAPSISQQVLTARGATLREEVVTPRGGPTTWKGAVDAFTDYIWRQWKASNTWEAEKGVSPTSHRFTEDASIDRYARTLGAERAAFRLWGDTLTTAFVTRRARAFGRNGQPQPPADHLLDLLTGNPNVYRSYNRHIEDNHGLTYARLSVLEPHRNGYPHIHDALFIEDPDNVIGEVDLTPAIDSHLRAVPQARPRAHGSEAVDVRNNPDRDRLEGDPEGVPPITGLSREMTKLLGGLAPHDETTELKPNVPPVLQAECGPLRFYALLWATGTPQWRPDNSVFPTLVNASQEWWSDGEDTDETYVDPADLETQPRGSNPTVDVEGREVGFERFEAGGSLG
jgi:hypothetical protein